MNKCLLKDSAWKTILSLWNGRFFREHLTWRRRKLIQRLHWGYLERHQCPPTKGLFFSSAASGEGSPFWVSCDAYIFPLKLTWNSTNQWGRLIGNSRTGNTSNSTHICIVWSPPRWKISWSLVENADAWLMMPILHPWKNNMEHNHEDLVHRNIRWFVLALQPFIFGARYYLSQLFEI